MVKVPVYERQVQTKTPQVSEMRHLRPAPGAFGGEVGQALQDLGNTGEKISQAILKRVAERKAQDNDLEIARLDTAFREDMQNALLNDENNEQGVPKGLLSRKLGQAKGITVEYDRLFLDKKKDYIESLKDDRQKQALNQLMDQRYLADRETIIRHERIQGDEDADNVLKANLTRRVDDAALVTNPQDLCALIDQSVQLQTVGHKHKGSDEETINLENAAIAGQIAKSSVMATLEVDPALSQQKLNAVKDRIPKTVLVELQQSIDGKKFADSRVQTWNEVQSFRLGDGTPDRAKMQSYVYSLEGFTTDQKEKLWDYVKGRAAEDEQNMIKLEGAENKRFLERLYKIKSEGKGFDEAIKLAGHGNAYERGQREEVVKRLYGAPANTDPSTYMMLWEGIRDGRVKKEDIDRAQADNRLAVNDWQGLRQEFYRSRTEGIKSQDDAAWNRIGQLAVAHFGNDQKKKNAYLYEVKKSAEGKTPEEAFVIAQDKLKTDQKSGWWVFGKREQWQTDLARRDAQDVVWGKIYGELGKDTVMAIGQGLIAGGKPAWNYNDVIQFAEALGGYEKIKPGTPAAKAMRYLIDKGELTTVANVKAVIKHFKLDDEKGQDGR